jgi:hypothetical protein
LGVDGVNGKKSRIGNWERELVIGVTIVLLALLTQLLDGSLNLPSVLWVVVPAILLLAVSVLAWQFVPAFQMRLRQWAGDRRLWYGVLAVFAVGAVLALSLKVERLESTAIDQTADVSDIQVTQTAQASEAASLRTALAKQATEITSSRSTSTSSESRLANLQSTWTAQPTPSPTHPRPTDTPTAPPTPADIVTRYWAHVGHGEYTSAWELLSPGFQTARFDLDFNQYANGMQDWLDTLCHMEVARAQVSSEAADKAQVNAIMFYRIKPDCSNVYHEFEFQLVKGSEGDWLLDQVTQID